jgi:hypothetical protein|tara:strand:- start:847 stop:1122 length:276 start_codon:yes stop_codon:yes gene_type:complete
MNNNKKINKVFSTITVSLLILMSIAILGTYLSDYLESIKWFGDSEPYTDERKRLSVDWGARHYWYNWGVALLFLTSLGRAVAQVVIIIDED